MSTPTNPATPTPPASSTMITVISPSARSSPAATPSAAGAASPFPPPAPPRAPRFTPAMRERQARGKEPRSGRAVAGEEEPGGGEGKKTHISYVDDSYEAVERRRWAATVLGDAELLMMHAQAREDTIPSTRLHLTKLMCGYDEPPRRREKKAQRTRQAGAGRM